MEVVSVTFVEEPEVHESFSLHARAEVVVRRVETGEDSILSSIDVLVKHGSGWKLVNVDGLQHEHAGRGRAGGGVWTTRSWYTTGTWSRGPSTGPP